MELFENTPNRDNDKMMYNNKLDDNNHFWRIPAIDTFSTYYY